MKIVKLRSNPDHAFEGKTDHFGGVWEVELARGESTPPRTRAEREEIYCCVEGAGQIFLATERHPLTRGEVFFVPRETERWLENPSSGLLRCLYVASPPLPIATAPAESDEVDAPAPTLEELEEQLRSLPKRLDQAEAIQRIVQLFDTAGHLSEAIENALGLDTESGVSALTSIERQVMDAVVEISRRYQRPGLDLGTFGGRLRGL